MVLVCRGVFRVHCVEIVKDLRNCVEIIIWILIEICMNEYCTLVNIFLLFQTVKYVCVPYCFDLVMYLSINFDFFNN